MRNVSEALFAIANHSQLWRAINLIVVRVKGKRERIWYRCELIRRFAQYATTYRLTRQWRSISNPFSDTLKLHQRHVYKLLQIIDPLCAIATWRLLRRATWHSVTVCWKDDTIDFPYFFINLNFSGLLLLAFVLHSSFVLQSLCLWAEEIFQCRRVFATR